MAKRRRQPLYFESENREVITEFINAYKKLPELWDVTHEDYSNKYKRDNAYESLVPILKKLYIGATRYHVRMKINTLRSNYRKELRRHLASKYIGPDGKEEYSYHPAGWKFYALSFLDNDEQDANLPTGIEEVRIEEHDGSCEEASESSTSANDEMPTFLENSTMYFEDEQDHVPNNRKKVAVNHRKQSADKAVVACDDEFKAIGANVSFKLKRMNQEQRYHAELLINKVLINGLRNNLTDDTDLTDLQVLDKKFHSCD